MYETEAEMKNDLRLIGVCILCMFTQGKCACVYGGLAIEKKTRRLQKNHHVQTIVVRTHGFDDDDRRDIFSARACAHLSLLYCPSLVRIGCAVGTDL